jgi:hypothetical protein
VFVTPITLNLATDVFTFYDTENSVYLNIINPTVSGGSVSVSPTTRIIYITNITVGSIGSGVSFPTPSVSETISANSTVRITAGISIRSLVNSGTKNSFFQISRNGHSFASSSIPITVTPNKFTLASISQGTTVVSKSTSYTFTVLLRNNLISGASMKIVLPS